MSRTMDGWMKAAGIADGANNDAAIARALEQNIGEGKCLDDGGAKT